MGIDRRAGNGPGPADGAGTFPLLRHTIDVAAQDDQRAAVEIGRLTARLWALRRLSLSVAGALEPGETPIVEGALVKEVTSAQRWKSRTA